MGVTRAIDRLHGHWGALPASGDTTLTPVLRAGLGLAAAFAIASLATQAYWMATGDDFGLGLVPAFNPAGVGNLQAFVITAALACCAAWMAVLAAALRVHDARGGAAWVFLATGTAFLSLQQFAIPRPRLGGDPAWLAVGYAAPPALRPRDALLGAAIVLLGAVAAWAWVTAARARGRLAAGALAFSAGVAIDAVAGGVTVAASTDPRLAPALLTTAARALELIGVALVADAVTLRLGTVAPDLRLVIDDDAPRAIAATRLSDGLAVRMSPRRIGYALFAAAALLVVTSVATYWAYERWPALHRPHRLFYVDHEANVPTWWSAMLLLASGAVAALQAARSRRVLDRRWLDWLTLAALFVALAADEAASLHELLQKPVRSLLGSESWLRYPLIVPGTLVAIVLVVRFRRFLRTLGPTRRRLAIAAAVFAAGALGFETLGGWFAPEAIGPNTTYLALTTIEEALEMTGATLALLALVRHVESDSMAGTIQPCASSTSPA
jgi:hypothetical protein